MFGIIEGDKLTSFSIATRLSLIEVLSQLQWVDRQAQNGQNHGGYRLLYQLLCDVPIQDDETTSPTDTSSTAKTPDHVFANRSLPVRRCQSFYNIQYGSNRPKFASWMRELAFAVEQSIKPASFLTGVLDYQFDITPALIHRCGKRLSPGIDEQKHGKENCANQSHANRMSATPEANEHKTLLSLVDNTAIIYLV